MLIEGTRRLFRGRALRGLQWAGPLVLVLVYKYVLKRA